ncbi:hypothetical protein HYPSUDRAFT_41907, partial [Hypholoma sublateritium FD-334 SS-4]
MPDLPHGRPTGCACVFPAPHFADRLQAFDSTSIRKVFCGNIPSATRPAPASGHTGGHAPHEPDPAVVIASLRADIIRMQTEMIESVNAILVDATVRDTQLLRAMRAMQAVASQNARENMHAQRRQRVAALEANVAALAEDVDGGEEEGDEPQPLWYGERNIEANRAHVEERTARTWIGSLSSFVFGSSEDESHRVSWSMHQVASPQIVGTRASRRRIAPSASSNLNVTAQNARRQVPSVRSGPSNSPLRYGSNVLCIGERRPAHTGVPDCIAANGRHHFNGLGSNRYQKKYNFDPFYSIPSSTPLLKL